MPHHKSAAKRVRTNEKRRRRNAAARSRLRSVVRSVRATADPTRAETLLRQAVSELDRAAKRGLVKRATADRQKSRLARYRSRLSS
jgi:small subunit ribosomal protein S20